MLKVLEKPSVTQNRQDFADNCDDVTADRSKDPTSHEHQNNLAEKAKMGNSQGTNTSIAQNNEKERKALASQKISCARSFASATGMTLPNSFNLNLAGISLDDSHMIDIREDGVLVVRGDGPESDFRPMTTEELVQVETESAACSLGFTEEQQATQEYLSGATNEMPQYLEDLAGHDASTMTRDELAQIVRDEYAATPHIANRMTGDIPLTPGGLNTDMNMESLLPERTGISASPALFTSEKLNKMFEMAHDGQTSAPAQTPLPTPAPAMSIAPS